MTPPPTPDAQPSLADVARAQHITRLNMGAGKRPVRAAGWINQDLFPGPGIDKAFDLSGAWPFMDGALDELYAMHVLEHVPDVAACMREAQRCLRVGGHFLIRVPYGSNHSAMGDLTHRRPFYEASFYDFVPSVTQYTLNPEHDAERWPSLWMIDEMRLIVEPDVARWRPKWLVRWTLPLLKRHLNNIIAEMWVRLHRIDESQVRYVPRNEETHILIMRQDEAIAQMKFNCFLPDAEEEKLHATLDSQR